jgi:hypothetical protein
VSQKEGNVTEWLLHGPQALELESLDALVPQACRESWPRQFGHDYLCKTKKIIAQIITIKYISSAPAAALKGATNDFDGRQ